MNKDTNPPSQPEAASGGGQAVKDRDNASLIDLALQLYARSISYPNSKEMHDGWVAAVNELKQRFDRLIGGIRMCYENYGIESVRCYLPDDVAAKCDEDRKKYPQFKTANEQLIDTIASLDRLREENERLESVLRSLASWLGNGGYNADKVDPAEFEAKIRDGVATILKVETERAMAKVAKISDTEMMALLRRVNKEFEQEVKALRQQLASAEARARMLEDEREGLRKAHTDYIDWTEANLIRRDVHESKIQSLQTSLAAAEARATALQSILELAATSLKPDVYSTQESWMRAKLADIEHLARKAMNDERNTVA